MKALVAALSLALLAAPALAADAAEDELYHWGECQAMGGLFEAAVDHGSSDPRITAALTAFQNFAPEMESHTNALAERLGEARADAVREKLLADFDADIDRFAAADDRDGSLLATWGKTMDRCLKEAAALSVSENP